MIEFERDLKEKKRWIFYDIYQLWRSGSDSFLAFTGCGLKYPLGGYACFEWLAEREGIYAYLFDEVRILDARSWISRFWFLRHSLIFLKQIHYCIGKKAYIRLQIVE